MAAVTPLKLTSGLIAQMVAGTDSILPGFIGSGTATDSLFLRGDGVWAKQLNMNGGSGSAAEMLTFHAGTQNATTAGSSQLIGFRTTGGYTAAFGGYGNGSWYGAGIWTGASAGAPQLFITTNNRTLIGSVADRGTHRLQVNGAILCGTAASEGALGAITIDGAAHRIYYGTDGTGYALEFAKNVAGAQTVLMSLYDTQGVTIINKLRVGSSTVATNFLDVSGTLVKTSVGGQQVIAGFWTAETTTAFGLVFTVSGAAASVDRIVDLQTQEQGVGNIGKLALQRFAGQVGVGVTPTAKLHVFSGLGVANTYSGQNGDLIVEGTNRVFYPASGGTNEGNIVVASTSPGAADMGGSISFAAKYTNVNDGAAFFAKIKAGRDAGANDGSVYTGYLAFGVQTGSGVVEAMRLTSAKYFGIGTTTPRATLDVVGNILTDWTNGAPRLIGTQFSDGTAGYYLGLKTIPDTRTLEIRAQAGAETGATVSIISFLTNNTSGVLTQMARINNAGFYSEFTARLAPTQVIGIGAAWDWAATTVQSATNAGLTITSITNYRAGEIKRIDVQTAGGIAFTQAGFAWAPGHPVWGTSRTLVTVICLSTAPVFMGMTTPVN